MKILPLIAALNLLAAPAIAQTCGGVDLIETLSAEDSETVAAAVADVPFADGILFEATRGGDTVTVIGTLHIPDSRHAATLARIEARVEAADILLLEATKEDEAAILAMTAERPDLFFLTDGPSLIDILGPEDWDIAKDRFSEIGMPGILGAKLRPWYANMVLGLPPCVTSLMASGQPGLDRMIEDRAETAGVPIAALEDAREMIAMMAGGEDAEDAEALRLTLRSDMTGAEMTSTLIENYFEGDVWDVMALTRLLAERDMPGQGAALFDDFTGALIDRRNAQWEAALPAFIDGRDAVIAVGAAHLPGETGVLRALERAGYSVRPLP